MAKEDEKKSKEESHTVHERTLNYYKKTVSLLSVALEVFFLFFIGAIIFLFVASNDASIAHYDNEVLLTQINALKSQIGVLEDQVIVSQLGLPSSQLYHDQFITTFLLRNNIPMNITVQVDDMLAQIQEGYQRRELVQEVNIPMHTKYAQKCYDFALFCATDPSDILSLKNYYGEELQSLKSQGSEYVVLPLGIGTSSVMDFRDFVSPTGFEDELKNLYITRKNDREFLEDIWFIVSSLTSYSQEIKESPRYPLETLLLGGGDCEDTAILFASMLTAANTPWKISFLYTDINNPSAPLNFNHVLVHVDTGVEEFFVETTGHQVMEPYQEVSGSFLRIS